MPAPPNLPTDSTNATASEDTHPALHNDVNAGVNDHENRIDAVEAALPGKQDADDDLSAIALLSTTPFGRGFLPLTSASGARTYLGLGALAILSTINNSNWSGADLTVVNGGTGASDAATARSNLGAAATSHTHAQADVTDLTTDLAAKATEATRSASGKGYVNHGATAGTTRPSGYASVEWVGSVEPTNAVDGDTWIDTSA